MTIRKFNICVTSLGSSLIVIGSYIVPSTLDSTPLNPKMGMFEEVNSDSLYPIFKYASWIFTPLIIDKDSLDREISNYRSDNQRIIMGELHPFKVRIIEHDHYFNLGTLGCFTNDIHYFSGIGLSRVLGCPDRCWAFRDHIDYWPLGLWVMISIVVPSIVVYPLVSTFFILGELAKLPSSDHILNLILELSTIISVVTDIFMEPTVLVLVSLLGVFPS